MVAGTFVLTWALLTAEPTAAPDVMCAGRSGEDATLCRAQCTEWPASRSCMLARALGFGGVRAVVIAGKVAEDDPQSAVSVPAVGQKLGLELALIRRATLYADWTGLVKIAVPSAPDSSAARDALSRVASAKARAEDHAAAGRPAQAADALVAALPALEEGVGRDHPRIINAHRTIARLRADAGQLDQACGALDAAVEAAGRLWAPAHPSVADVRLEQAELEQQAGRLSDARAHLEEALEVRELVLGPEHIATLQALDRLGGIATAMRDPKAAAGYYARALAVAAVVMGPDSNDVAVSHSNLGTALLQLGRTDAAIVHLEEALVRKEQRHGPAAVTTAVTRDNLGLAYAAARRLAEARDHQERAAAALEAAGAFADQVRALLNLAGTELALGRLDAAGQRAREALKVAQRRRAEVGGAVEAEAQNGLAAILLEAGDLEGARGALEAALALRRSLASAAGTAGAANGSPKAGALLAGHAQTVEVARSLSDLAMLWLRLGDTTTAAGLWRQAVATFEAAGGASSTVEGLTLRTHLAYSTAMLGQPDAAHAELAVVVERLRALEDPAALGNALDALAAVHMVRRDTAAAASAAREAEAQLRVAHGESSARASAARGRLGAALLDAGDARGAADALGNAIARLETALGPSSPNLAPHRVNQANALAALGDRVGAREAASRASTGLRAALVLELDASPSDLDLVARVAAGRPAFEALMAVTEDPTRSLAAALEWQGLGTAAEVTRRDLQRLSAAASSDQRGLLARLAAAQRAVLRGDAAAVATRDQLETALRTSLPGFAERRRVLDATPEALCAALGGAALVDYVEWRGFDPKRKDDPTTPADERTRSSLSALVVTGRPSCTVRRVELGPMAAVDAAVDAWRRATDAAGACWESGGACEAAYHGMDTAGAALAARVWRPLTAHLPSGGRVWVVPDGRLTEVPLDALPGEDRRPLIETWTLGLLPYPAALLAAPAAGPAQGALVVGDLAYDAEPPRDDQAVASWLRCDGGVCKPSAEPVVIARRSGTTSGVCGYDARWTDLTPTEASAVAATLGSTEAGPVLLATGAHAPASAVRAALKGRRIVHIATHGFFAAAERCAANAWTELPRVEAGLELRTFAVDPLRLTAVALSGANRSATGDGLLSARDVSGLDLRGTELVALSACETGLGRTAAGEGALGLGRSFLIAGARVALVSLWKVPSEPTARLFERFYAALARDGDAVEALRSAKRALIAELTASGEGVAPFHWGAFVPLVGAAGRPPAPAAPP